MSITAQPAAGSGLPDTGVVIEGFQFRTDRAYEPREGMWVLAVGGGVHRIGFNALTADSYGALAQLVLGAADRPVVRGAEFGSLEAAKFVGPLISPLSGTVRAVNDAALEDPGLVLASPYDDGWLLEIEVGDDDPDLERLLTGDQARRWFARSVAEHREKGLVAE